MCLNSSARLLTLYSAWLRLVLVKFVFYFLTSCSLLMIFVMESNMMFYLLMLYFMVSAACTSPWSWLSCNVDFLYDSYHN